jgi:hypothetical protein
MSSTQASNPLLSGRLPALPVSWRSWPLGEGGAQFWLLLVLLVVVAGSIGLVTGSSRLALSACVLVCLAAWRFFVPVVFELNAMGISQQILGFRRRIAWRSIDRFEVCSQGIFLSLAEASFSSFRGLYIPWEGHREEVLAMVEYYLPHARREGPPQA